MMMIQEKRIKKLVDLIERDTSIDAPSDVVVWAKNLYRTRAAEGKPSLLRKIVAVLQADLIPNATVFGERSAPPEARQMFFSAEDNGVDLRVTSVRGSLQVLGQLIGLGFENASVELISDEASFSTTASDGVFRLPDITSGAYSLIATGTTAEIRIEQLDL